MLNKWAWRYKKIINQIFFYFYYFEFKINFTNFIIIYFKGETFYKIVDQKLFKWLDEKMNKVE
jgi:hypothetical protein